MKSYLISSENGSALLEFSLILPILLLMLIGVVDLGLAIEQAMVVSDAAHTGTLYASVTGNGQDLQGMQKAANGAAAGVKSFTATATNWCSCSPNGTALSCSSSCGGAAPLQYAQVKTSATLPALMGYRGLPTSFSLKGFSAVRVQ